MQGFFVANLMMTATAVANFAYNFDPSTSGGVGGAITVTYLEKGAEISADLDLSKVNWDALTKVNGNCAGAISSFTWHIHSVWTNSASSGFLGQCSLATAGNHYDPLFACGPASEHVREDKCKPLTHLYKCTPDGYKANPLVCEKGDMSGFQ